MLGLAGHFEGFCSFWGLWSRRLHEGGGVEEYIMVGAAAEDERLGLMAAGWARRCLRVVRDDTG